MDSPYREVYERYLAEALAVDAPGVKLLKTDANNEMQNWPEPAGIAPNLQGEVILLEIDPAVISRARENHPELDIREGDIRDMRTFDSQFDAVLDFSTIDHIPCQDTKQAIAEYARILHPKGKLIIVCWTRPEDAEGDGQNYHSTNRIEGELAQHFEIDQPEVLLDISDGALLRLWHGVKRG